jgi:hypothetical protein
MVTPHPRFSRRTKIVAVGSLTAFFVIGGSFLFYKFHTSTPEVRTRALSNLEVNSSNRNLISSSNANANVSSNVQAVKTASSPLFTTTKNGNKTTFKSNDLKVNFDYISQVNNGGAETNIIANEQGNKITIYPENSPNTYDYVQVFSKNPTDTLEQAITKSILKGFNPTDCPIGVAYGFGNNKFSSSTQTASIQYNSNNEHPESGYPVDATKCPSEYTAVETARFFLMDKNHPDRFVFILDGIALRSGVDSSGKIKGWEDTFNLF